MVNFLDSSDPNEIRNVINALAARVAELELRNTQFDSADQAMNSIDDLDYRAKDSNGAVKMIMSGRNLLEEFGIDAHFAGLDANGIPQFYVSADTGAIAALGGKLLINSDGLSIDGLNLAQYFFGSNAGNERQAWMGMYLPQDSTIPVFSIIFTGPDGTNLIVNGTAETGDEAGWTDANSAWSPSTVSPYSESYSFKHNSSSEVFPGKLLQNVAVTAGNVYSFAFTSRLESGILSPYVKLVWKTSAPAVISTDTIYGTHANSWQFAQQTFFAPTTAASVDIELYPGDPFNDCYIDAFTLFLQAISTELRLSDHGLNAYVDGVRYNLLPTYVDYLIVGGGGGGGANYYSGGGGAGGFLSGSNMMLTTGTTYPITVGAGGNGGASEGLPGSDGGSSIFNGLTAIGGGGGGANAARNGRNGGSGGGAHYQSATGGTGTGGQGSSGGAGSGSGGAGGGGGASAVGGAGSATGGNGGAGTSSSITGTAVTYAGGAGGGSGGGAGGTGGAGGGGNGGSSGSNTATAGAANTGGGGGGQGGTIGAGKAGGSGVVILRIFSSNYTGITTGSPTVTTDGSYTIMKFTSSGSYTA